MTFFYDLRCYDSHWQETETSVFSFAVFVRAFTLDLPIPTQRWATPRLSELAAASSSPAMDEYDEDEQAGAAASTASTSRIMELSIMEETEIGGPRGGASAASTTLSLEAKQFFWHIVDFASHADDGAR